MRSPSRVFVPGRIEVLGKHTDYAGGSSLLVATERGFTFEASAQGNVVEIVADGTGETTRWEIRRREGAVATVAITEAGPRPRWVRYADAVLARLAAEFGHSLAGARIRFRSDLPVAAGLSSSSALVTGIFLALDAVCRFSDQPGFRERIPDRPALAAWLAAAEMGGPVGTRGGSEDHVAILCAEPGRVVRYGLAPIRYGGSVPAPEGWTFAVGVSGVVADKGGAVQTHYNRLSDLAAGAARAWAAATGKGLPADDGVSSGAGEGQGLVAESDSSLNLGRALEISGNPDAVLAGVRAGAKKLGLPVYALVQRARHFLEETALLDAAFAALEAGDVAGFGAAANQSADLGAELLANQVPETLALATSARELGAPAASPFGGGFGGSVWALVRAHEAEAFLASWRSAYVARHQERTADATFFSTPAAAPARNL